MKKLLLLIFPLMVLAQSSQAAQETYSVTAPAQDVAFIDRSRVKRNTAVCARFNLAASCTQGQACTAAGAAGGASCTAIQARAVDVEIFANTLAGRETFFIQKILKRVRDEVLKLELGNDDAAQKCINWRAGNDTVKDAMCAAAGSPVPATVALGCQLCSD